MQKILTILRHAEAERASATQDDHERALSAQGLGEAKALGLYLRSRSFAVQHVLCSTSLRTRQTWEELHAQHPLSVQTEFTPALYLASAKELMNLVQGLPEDWDSAMLIGHNPGLHSLCLMLAGAGEITLRTRMAGVFPAGALAVLTFDRAWHEVAAGSATLTEFVTPELLERA